MLERNKSSATRNKPERSRLAKQNAREAHNIVIHEFNRPNINKQYNPPVVVGAAHPCQEPMEAVAAPAE